MPVVGSFLLLLAAVLYSIALLAADRVRGFAAVAAVQSIFEQNLLWAYIGGLSLSFVSCSIAWTSLFRVDTKRWVIGSKRILLCIVVFSFGLAIAHGYRAVSLFLKTAAP